MKKIKILSFSRTNLENYGGLLQTYALCTVLRRMEAICEPLNYYPKAYHASGLHKIKSIFYKIFSILFGSKKRIIRTKKFAINQIGFAPKKLKNTNSLKKAVLKSDILILGSDQIWNPYINNHDNNFYGNFCKLSKIKIYSYAASFGRTEFKNNELEFIKNNLVGIDVISVREEHAKKILDQISIPSRLDLDPTLLLSSNDWNIVAKESRCNISEPYILCYIMPGNSDVVKNIKEVARCESKKTGIKKIVYIGQKYSRFLEKNNYFSAGPSEWVYLFKNASLIITNSFHGVVFSILYQKKFWSIVSKDTSQNVLTSRIESILSILNLKDRMISSPSEINDCCLEYEYAMKKIKNLRLNSLKYLNSIIFSE